MSTLDDFTVPWSIARRPAPWLRYGPDGGAAEITFLVALDDLPAFADTLIGQVETIDIGGGATMERIVPLLHPDDPSLCALGYHAEAYGTPGDAGASIHATQFSHHRVRVDFGTLPFGTEGDQPYYSLSDDTGEQFLSVPGLRARFSDGSTTQGDYAIPISVTNITLTTYLSATPTTYATRQMIGKINSLPFDDIPAYMLRFTGIKTDFARGSYSRSLTKSYSFQYRNPHWNMSLRGDGFWDVSTLGATGLGTFQATDLNLLKYL